MLVAAVVMVDDKRHAHEVGPIARLAFTAGVLASVAANIAAAHTGVGARIVVVEMLARPPASAGAEVQPADRAVGQQPAELPVQQPRPPVAAEVRRLELPAAVGTGRRPVTRPQAASSMALSWRAAQWSVQHRSKYRSWSNGRPSGCPVHISGRIVPCSASSHSMRLA